jgi:hypothetical protein
MNERRDFAVTLNVTSQVTYIVNSRSEEEAEVIAADLLGEGEEPFAETVLEVVPEDTLPIDESPDLRYILEAE